MRHSAKLAWRALALLQTELEQEAAASGYVDVVTALVEIGTNPSRFLVREPEPGMQA